ncbi:hypothetical protein ACHQM5_017133 [Ranunculus cassubicifolius]
MERLPAEISLKIFHLLDHQTLATSQQVCRNWKNLASEDVLWCNFFKERWGEGNASFYAPNNDNYKSWKQVYQVQDRCDRVGLGLKIIREAGDYYLVHQGMIQRYLGSRNNDTVDSDDGHFDQKRERSLEPCSSIFDNILFFIGDLEVATNTAAKRTRFF